MATACTKYQSAAFYVLHAFLFVSVCNDLLALSLEMKIKPGFIMMVIYAFGLIFYRLWRKDRWWLDVRFDSPVLIWAVLAIVFCVVNGGVRNYAYTSAMLVFLSVVLNAKSSVFHKNKLRIFDAFLMAGIIVSFFGLLQFFFGLVGLGDAFFVKQWWYEGVIARVNGLMYEPSYYALVVFPFVVVGFFLSDLHVLSLRRSRLVRFLFWLSISALIQSSSRVSILACALTLPILAIIKYYYFFPIHRTWVGDLKRILVFVISVFGFFLIVETSTEQLSRSDGAAHTQSVLNGTGLGGSASHSVSMRVEAMENTVRLANQHLIIGVGLGNVAYGIAKNRGVDNPTLAEAKQFEGLVPIIEISAATGVVGALLFTGWILFLGWDGALRRNISTEHAAIQAALSFSMLCQFALMQANQNVLRMYFWITLFVLMVFVYSNIRLGKRGAES